MKNLDKKEWDFSAGEKYAIKWLEDNDFEVVINKRYISKTIFSVTKNGVTDNFNLPLGDEKINYKKVMEQFAKNFELYCELKKLREQVRK